MVQSIQLLAGSWCNLFWRLATLCPIQFVEQGKTSFRTAACSAQAIAILDVDLR